MIGSNELFVEERARISDVVIRYATALDTRDWPLLASCLTDPIAIDYSSFDPELDFEMAAGEWLRRVEEGLSGFDATQHLSCNHRFHFAGPEDCTCISSVQAAHFLKEANGQSVCTLHGYYTNRLLKSGEEWRIRQCRLVITASQGDADVFARATKKYLKGRSS